MPVRIDPPQEASEREAQDQRVEDLSQFASGLVHDVNNTLNVMRTNLYLLTKWVPKEEPRANRALQRVEEQVTATQRLMSGVQAFYKAKSPSLKRGDVNQLVREVAASINLAEVYTLATELDETLPPVQFDPQLLESALRALIRNAVEALGAGGTITLKTLAGGRGVLVLVEDSAGALQFPDGQNPFAPFVSTRKGHGGLGLAMVDRVARAHDGAAYFEVEPAAYTRAVMELPAV